MCPPRALALCFFPERFFFSPWRRCFFGPARFIFFPPPTCHLWLLADIKRFMGGLRYLWDVGCVSFFCWVFVADFMGGVGVFISSFLDPVG